MIALYLPIILRFGKIALIVGFFWIVYDFVMDSFEKSAQIVLLQQTIEEKNDVIRAMEFQAELDAAAEVIVREAEKVAEIVKEKYEDISRDIYTIEDTDNGTISPVLRDTINALDGL